MLAIETAGRGGSVAIGHAGVVEHVMPLPVGRRHNVQLALGIQQILDKAGLTLADLGAIAVALGPGSFTGIRVGVTVAKTLAYARGLDLIGVPSMDVLVQNTPAGIEQVAVVMNAKRGTVYTGRFERDASSPIGFTELGTRDLVPSEDVIAWGLPVIAEQGAADGFDGLAEGQLLIQGDSTEADAKDDLRGTSSGGVLRGAEVQWGRGELADPATLAPLYIREPEAVTLWQTRGPRK